MFTLRPFQKQAIEALKSNSPSAHVICVAPTGSGKSLIYEEVAAMANRKTLLVTPLVALARQQFKKMKERGISVTMAAGGSVEGPPVNKTGAWIVSPESLQSPRRQAALASWQPNFLVLDECHCLWEWGERFRPALQYYSTPISHPLYSAQSLVDRNSPLPCAGSAPKFDTPVSRNWKICALSADLLAYRTYALGNTLG